MPQYLFESYTHSIFERDKVAISILDLLKVDPTTGKPSLYWDKAVGKMSCTQCLSSKGTDDWERCWEDRERWIDLVRRRSEGWQEIQYCNQNRMNRLFPIEDEKRNLLGLMIPGFIIRDDRNFEVGSECFLV